MTVWAIAIGVLIIVFVAAVTWVTPHGGRRREKRPKGTTAEILFFSRHAPQRERGSESNDRLP